ncbi:MAG: hypothetical protein ABIQ93_16945, partial [Saprospiraceae bacterium]
MPDFNDKRIQLQNARQQTADTETALLLAKEALKKISAAGTGLDRVFNPDNEQHRAERSRLEREKEKLGGEINALKDRKAALYAAVDGHFGAFLFADPQHQISELSDDTPFLLFPVRLETRFKTLAERNGIAKNQLWVRIFPDDCMVDSFEAELSESEAKNAREFWANMWKAGGVRTQEQAAWRSLVASHGAGRSAWIMKNADAAAQNTADKPVKAKETDIILVIPADADLTPAQRSALKTYWQTVWLADGDKAKTDSAFTAIATNLGISPDDAGGLLKLYAPINFLEKPTAPLQKADVQMSVVFIVFKKPADLATKQTSWTRAPKVNVLPDRFVLILDDGNTNKPLEFVGKPIPSPLTVGVDPSADKNDQLKQVDGEMTVSEEMKWMVDFERAVEWGMGFKIDLS